jgi:hypothetical protein
MADTVTFEEPQGFVPPENIGDDNTFQAMATFKVMPNNQLQLVDIEGYQVGEGEQEGEEEQGPEGQEGTEGAQPLPGAASQGRPPTANMSEDQLAPGANQTRTGGFAEVMAQRFRKATGRR